MKIIAIIPARGGSKGIPRKNIILINGKPLLAYSIEHAKATPQISRVIVSTDDREIEEVSHRHGAEVIARPADISGDKASSEAALLHALDVLEKREKYIPDSVVFLQATSPLREADDIKKALDLFISTNADSLFSAFPLEGFLWRIDSSGLRSLSYDYSERKPRQDRGEDLVENGSIYIFKPSVIRAYNNRLGGKIVVHRMDILNSFQIDEPSDVSLIEKIITLKTIGK